MWISSSLEKIIIKKRIHRIWSEFFRFGFGLVWSILFIFSLHNICNCTTIVQRKKKTECEKTFLLNDVQVRKKMEFSIHSFWLTALFSAKCCTISTFLSNLNIDRSIYIDIIMIMIDWLITIILCLHFLFSIEIVVILGFFFCFFLLIFPI